MAVMYKEKLYLFLQTLRATPSLLEKKYPEMTNFLQRQGNLAAQGTGNKVTDQEACFATELEKIGFTFLPKGSPNPDSGFYYKYQVNGSQQEGDFGLYAFQEGAAVKSHLIDLKHTNSKKFYFNDGWFQQGVIYIVSWNAGTAKYPNLKAHIALGQDVPSEEEKRFMAELREFRRKANAENRRVGSLFPYVRFANQYACENFTDETSKLHYDSVIEFI
jgi:hypothetical protein